MPASVAVMVTEFCPPPRSPVREVIVKVFEVAPAGTSTVVGTVAFLVSPLLSVTERPPAGAAPLSVTVPVDRSDGKTRSFSCPDAAAFRPGLESQMRSRAMTREVARPRLPTVGERLRH